MKKLLFVCLLLFPAITDAASRRIQSKFDAGDASIINMNFQNLDSKILTHRHDGNGVGSPGIFPLVGMMIPYASTTVTPTGWLQCNGASYSTTTYSLLYNVIGYVFGGSGANFNVPDARGRALIGQGTGAGLTARTNGATGGTETHTLTATEMPSHTHTATVTDPGHSHTERTDTAGGTATVPASATASNNSGAPFDSVTSGAATSISVSNSSTGGGGAHNNMQPFLVVGCLIYAAQ